MALWAGLSLCASGLRAGQCGNCDDGYPCTADLCDPSDGCVHSTINCDDGGGCIDCNGNGIPDACDLTSLFVIESGELSPIGNLSSQTFVISSPPPAFSDVRFDFTASADFGSSAERLDVDLNLQPIGVVFFFGANDCPLVPDEDQIILDMAVFEDLVRGGDASIKMYTPTTVDPNLCDPPSFVTVTVSYVSTGTSQDDNANGVPDECDVVPCAADLDGDGQVGAADLAALLGAWGSGSAGPADLNGDGDVGAVDLAILLGSWGPSC